MNPEIKQKWIDALRSGRYKQSRYALRSVGSNDKSYCCLGVLCDIIDPKGWVGSNYQMFYYNGEIVMNYLPQTLMENLEIQTSNMGELVKLNDSNSYNFNEIANYIETNL